MLHIILPLALTPGPIILRQFPLPTLQPLHKLPFVFLMLCYQHPRTMEFVELELPIVLDLFCFEGEFSSLLLALDEFALELVDGAVFVPDSVLEVVLEVALVGVVVFDVFASAACVAVLELTLEVVAVWVDYASVA